MFTKVLWLFRLPVTMSLRVFAPAPVALPAVQTLSYGSVLNRTVLEALEIGCANPFYPHSKELGDCVKSGRRGAHEDALVSLGVVVYFLHCNRFIEPIRLQDALLTAVRELEGKFFRNWVDLHERRVRLREEIAWIQTAIGNAGHICREEATYAQSFTPQPSRDQYCHSCFKVIDDLKRQQLYPCQHCKMVFYCSGKCDESQWKKHHSKACKYLNRTFAGMGVRNFGVIM